MSLNSIIENILKKFGVPMEEQIGQRVSILVRITVLRVFKVKNHGGKTSGKNERMARMIYKKY